MPSLFLRLLALKTRLSGRFLSSTRGRARAGFFALVVALLAVPLPALAQTNVAGTPLNTDSFLQFLASVAFAAAGAVVQLIVLMIDVLIPIMLYNDFINNPVVRSGWAIIRDTVNMFFVIVLIIIAFGTIFGHSRFQWQQQVPRLLIFAVVINFSRTLCGIMIDFSQVFMLTFANALREIAAGNFIQLLGLNQIYRVSQTSSAIQSVATDTGSGFSKEFDFFASGMVSFVLVVMVLAVMVVMVAILLFRIIGLWVLVAVAPLTWFVGGISGGEKGFINSSVYADWWKEFKCLVAVGPIITFFLWLTLAVAGTGNIAANSGFTVSNTANNADFTSSLLETANFMSFLIGIALLLAGLQAAAKFCGADIGLKTPSARMGALVGAAKSLPVVAGGAAARLTGAGIRTGTSVAAKGAPKLARSIMTADELSSVRNMGANVLGGIAGAGAGAAGALGAKQLAGNLRGVQLDQEAKVAANRITDVGAAREKITDKGRAWKANRINTLLGRDAETKRLESANTTNERMALFEEMMSDKRLRKEMGSEQVQQLWEDMGEEYRAFADGSASKTADLEGFERANLHFTKGSKVDKDGNPMETNEQSVQRLLSDSDDVKDLSDDAWNDDDVLNRTKAIQTTYRNRNGEYMNAHQAALAGHYGVDAQKNVLAKVDASQLNIGEEMEDQMARAINRNDGESAQKVIAAMAAQYAVGGTSPSGEDTQRRQQMAKSMDRMRASMARRARNNETASEMLTQFDRARSTMELDAGGPALPMPSETEGSPKAFVDENYGYAGAGRLDAAIGKADGEKNAASGIIEQLDAEYQALSQQGSDAQSQIQQKQQQLDRLRNKIRQDREKAITQARRDAEAAQKLLRKAEERGDGFEIAGARENYSQKQSTYRSLGNDLRNTIENDPAINQLQSDLDALTAQAATTGNQEAAQAKRRELNQAREKMRRLEETQKHLEELRRKRG